jgi:hypothetical protein
MSDDELKSRWLRRRGKMPATQSKRGFYTKGKPLFVRAPIAACEDFCNKRMRCPDQAGKKGPEIRSFGGNRP